jgi:hypothetical protein
VQQSVALGAGPDANSPLTFSFTGISIAEKFLLLTIKEHTYKNVVQRGNGVHFEKATASRLFEP